MATTTLIEDRVKLPMEILEQIFIWSECDRFASNATFLHSIEDDPNHLYANDEHPCLKSFRIVCKSWNGLATALLFKTIILLPNIASWDNLRNICTTSHLAQHVRTIRLATNRHVRLYKTLSEWDREACFGFSRLSTPNGGPHSSLPDDNLSSFRRYKDWYADELALRTHWEDNTAPELPLQLLPQFGRVETIGHPELATIKMKARISSLRNRVYWRNFQDRTPCEVQTLIEDVYPAEDMDTVTSISGFRHLDVFCTALRESRVSLPAFAVRSTVELSGEDDDGHTALIPGLRCLELDLGRYESKDTYLPLPTTSVSLAPWLDNLTSLTELSITMGVFCREWADIFHFLRDVHFPVLRIVMLKNVRTTYRTLNAFVKAHRGTLKYLSIIEPRLDPQDWVRFCDQEKGKAWTMEGKRLYLTEMFSVYLPNRTSGARFESS